MVTLLYCRVQFTSLIFFNVLLLVLSNEERRHLNIRRDEGNGVVLKTSYGRLAGFQAFIPSYFDVDEECKSHNNDASSRLPINVFLGIPFARPPIAELRFEVLSPDFNFCQYVSSPLKIASSPDFFFTPLYSCLLNKISHNALIFNSGI